MGDQSVKLGLADGIGHLVPKMKEVFGDKVKIIPYGEKKSWLQRIGANMANDVMNSIEERASYSRYGL